VSVKISQRFAVRELSEIVCVRLHEVVGWQPRRRPPTTTYYGGATAVDAGAVPPGASASMRHSRYVFH
jgi:hypothetical protein